MGLLCFLLHILCKRRVLHTVKDLLPNTVSQKDEKPHTVTRARSYRNNAHLK